MERSFLKTLWSQTADEVRPSKIVGNALYAEVVYAISRGKCEIRKLRTVTVLPAANVKPVLCFVDIQCPSFFGTNGITTTPIYAETSLPGMSERIRFPGGSVRCLFVASDWWELDRTLRVELAIKALEMALHEIRIKFKTISLIERPRPP